MSPTIRNNAQLLNGIEHEFGARFRAELIKEFPLLGEDHSNKIDLDTLKWVYDTGFSGKFSPGIQYVFSPFYEASNQRKGAKLMASRIFGLTYPKIRARPIILNPTHLNSVDAAFYDNGEYEYIADLLMGFFEKPMPEAQVIANTLYKKIFKNKNYIVGKDGLEHISGHTVILIGHSSAGYEYITDGKNKMTYKEVIETLMKSGIPSDVNLMLLHCKAASSNTAHNTGLSEDELTDLFIARKMKRLIGEPENSYAYKFAKELFKTWPAFSGSISAAYGKTQIVVALGIMRDPESSGSPNRHNLFPISFLDKDNESIYFDRSELRVIYKRENFPKDNNKTQGV